MKKSAPKPALEPLFFATPAAWRAWLEQHHAETPELLVGFYKKGTGRPSITWSEAVDQALCFGWIDGVGKSLGEHGFTHRFTPRRKRSIWSAVNIEKVRVLTEAGLMRPAGLAAFEARSEERSRVYSHEQAGQPVLSPEFQRRFEANARAWAYFQARAPSYQRACLHWVMTAKKEETRHKRMDTLLQESAEERTLRQFTPRNKSPPKAASSAPRAAGRTGKRAATRGR